jgi:phage-related protein
METFTWIPTYSSAATAKPRVLTAQYGDGYSQRTPDGLNSLPYSWDLIFIEQTTISQILPFLNAQLGATAFYWTPPRWTTQIKVICQKWSSPINDFGVTRVLATFEQVFDNSTS